MRQDRTGRDPAVSNPAGSNPSGPGQLVGSVAAGRCGSVVAEDRICRRPDPTVSRSAVHPEQGEHRWDHRDHLARARRARPDQTASHGLPARSRHTRRRGRHSLDRHSLDQCWVTAGPAAWDWVLAGCVLSRRRRSVRSAQPDARAVAHHGLSRAVVVVVVPGAPDRSAADQQRDGGPDWVPAWVRPDDRAAGRHVSEHSAVAVPSGPVVGVARTVAPAAACPDLCCPTVAAGPRNWTAAPSADVPRARGGRADEARAPALQVRELQIQAQRVSARRPRPRSGPQQRRPRRSRRPDCPGHGRNRRKSPLQITCASCKVATRPL